MSKQRREHIIKFMDNLRDNLILKDEILEKRTELELLYQEHENKLEEGLREEFKTICNKLYDYEQALKRVYYEYGNNDHLDLFENLK